MNASSLHPQLDDPLRGHKMSLEYGPQGLVAGPAKTGIGVHCAHSV
jgi:hypothetical protein